MNYTIRWEYERNYMYIRKGSEEKYIKMCKNGDYEILKNIPDDICKSFEDVNRYFGISDKDFTLYPNGMKCYNGDGFRIMKNETNCYINELK